MRKTIKLVCLVLCMIIIFLFSSDDGTASTKKSDSMIIKIIETAKRKSLTEKEKEKYINKYVVLVRKTAHFSIYFLLGFLMISYLREWNIVVKKEILYTILFVFLYAISDEIHQTFIPERSGRFLDVMIDTMGGTLAAVTYSLLFKWRKKNE